MIRLVLLMISALAMTSCSSESKAPKPGSGKAARDSADERGAGDLRDTAVNTGVTTGAGVTGATGTAVNTGGALGTAVEVNGGLGTDTALQTGVDQQNAVQGDLTASTMRVDDDGENYVLQLTPATGGAAQTQALTSGGAVSMAGLCKKDGETHVTIQILGDGRTYAPGVEGCFITTDDATGGTLVGFEESCNSNDWRYVDDTILLLRCPASKVVVDGATAVVGVPMNEWLN